jgi:hypothetical protein
VLGINSVCDDDGRSNLARWKNHTEKSRLIELLDERQSCKLTYFIRSIRKHLYNPLHGLRGLERRYKVPNQTSHLVISWGMKIYSI